jgi:hypothetical protein
MQKRRNTGYFTGFTILFGTRFADDSIGQHLRLCGMIEANLAATQ